MPTKTKTKLSRSEPADTAAAASDPATPYTLVLVESPSKCATIQKYLGDGYRVLATYGHFRTLNSLKNIVFSKDRSTLDLRFEVDDSKKQKYVSLLRRAIRDATGGVILATDDDREGEAIAWHVCDYFGLSVEDTPRIVFHEITKEAITAAMQRPTRVNMHLVHAQFTRQVLDLFIGFKISPLLWTFVSNNDKNSLSAGRCQTPALKMVVDNQTHIHETPTVLAYQVQGVFTSQHLVFQLTTPMETQEEVRAFLEESKTFAHVLTVEPSTTATRSSPLPLNTSRLQQVASNELHLSPKQTMSICQQLYEQGLITYMRTENTKFSRAFLAQTRNYLNKEGKGEMLTEHPGRVTESNNMAHEAIRPTNVNVGFLSAAKHDARTCKMYRLIWETSVASFMKPAVVSVRKAILTAPGGRTYTHHAELPVYEGWKAILASSAVPTENNIIKGFKGSGVGTSAYRFLKNVASGSPVAMSSITAKQECVGTRNHLHYTEAKLIRLLEEEGIGRPSTFASIVDKIQTRNYVAKENLEGTTFDCVDYLLDGTTKQLRPTAAKKTFGAEKNKLVVKPMGIVVARFLYQHFEPLFNFAYTKETETRLDQIHHGEANWVEVCAQQKEYIATLIKQAKENKMEKFHIPIDETHCYMIAKYGPVIRRTLQPSDPVSSNVEPSVTERATATETETELESKGKEKRTENIQWLPVRKDIELLRLERGEYTLADLLQTKAEPGTSAFLQEHTPGGLPLYGGHYFGVFQDKEIIVRTGKFGRYAAWGEENRSLKCFGRRDISNISMEEMTALLAKPKRGSKSVVGDLAPRCGDSVGSAASIVQIPKGESPKKRARKAAPLAPSASAPLPASSAPVVEQVPPKRPRPAKVPLAPKAPSDPLPNDSSCNPATDSLVAPPKKRGRPKKLENIIVDK